MTAAEWRARGNAALGQGNLAEARRCYVEGTKADPKDPALWLNLGFVNVETAQWAEAADSLTRAISLVRPGDDFLADAHYLRGRAREERGAHQDALDDYRAAASARPGFPEPMESAARLLGQLDRPAEALAVLDALLARHPDLAMAIEGRGTMLLRLGRADEARAAFERVLALEGESATRLSNLSAALHRLGRFEDAAGLARRALALAPDGREPAYNLAAVLLEMLRIDEALQVLERALVRNPGDADMEWNLAIGRLLRGELAPGFAAYESRFLCDEIGWRKPAPDFGRPRWNGRESLAGKSILLFAEQGLGDSIQFIRYVPAIASEARLVLLRLPRAFLPLMSSLPDNCRWVTESEPPPPTDFQSPLMSLPHAFGTTLETIPAQVPYLEAEPARVDAWRKRLDALGGDSPRVGVVWSGSTLHRNDRNRSIPLAAFRSVAAPGIQFVSLQPEVRESDRAEYDAWTGLARLGEELKDFADTAALVSGLDLVVTVDTSVAHVAGALARPVWILLPHYPDWRWMLGREDSPWYPTARLWRQPAARDWASVLARVRGELERVKGIEPSS